MRHIEIILTKDTAELSLLNWKNAQGQGQLSDLLQSDEVCPSPYFLREVPTKETVLLKGMLTIWR